MIREHLNKENIAFLVVSYLFAHFIIFILSLKEVYSFPQGMRFIVAKDLPILLYITLYFKREVRTILKIPILKKIAEFSFILFCLLSTIFLIGGLLSGKPFIEVFNWKWGYIPLLEWGFAIFLYYWLFKRKKVSRYESLVLALLFAYVGGIIYELPIYPYLNPRVGIYTHYAHPFLFSTRWIMIPLLILYMKRTYGFYRLRYLEHPQLNIFKGRDVLTIMFALTMLLLAFSCIWNRNYRKLGGWLPRLPTIFYLACWIFVSKRKIGKERKIEVRR